MSAQHSTSDDASNGSVKDRDNDSDDPRATNHETRRRRTSKHGTNKDLLHGGDAAGKSTAGKSRGRHKSFDVQRSKMVSGQGSSVDLDGQPQDAAATDSTGLLTVNSSNAMVSRSHQDLSGNVASRLSPHPSSSHVSSHTDVRGGLESAHRRSTRAVSASSSVGSGLDDDDYIDPHRDVGIAVCIRNGYFSWLPRANDEALMSDINFVADAGLCCNFAIFMLNLSGYWHLRAGTIKGTAALQSGVWL